MKKLVCMVTALLMFFSVAGLSGCRSKTVYETDFFRYQAYDFNIFGRGSKNYVEIIGLTELGKQQKTLVIPEKINEKPVLLIGISAGWGPSGKADFVSTELEKVFFEVSDISVERNLFSDCPNLKRIIVVRESSVIYASESIGKIYAKVPIYTEDSANILYYFNFDIDINNGICCIDDIDYGEKIGYVPKNPSRESYEFGGWYKEPNCENAWNFELDTLPNELLDDDGNVIYQETKLYAKWIKSLK